MKTIKNITYDSLKIGDMLFCVLDQDLPEQNWTGRELLVVKMERSNYVSVKSIGIVDESGEEVTSALPIGILRGDNDYDDDFFMHVIKREDVSEDDIFLGKLSGNYDHVIERIDKES